MKKWIDRFKVVLTHSQTIKPRYKIWKESRIESILLSP